MSNTNLGAWFQGIKGRLLMASIFPIVAFLVIFGFTYFGLQKINGLVENAHKNIIPSLSNLDDLRIYQNKFGYRMWEGLNSEEDRPGSIQEGKETLAHFKSSLKAYTEYPFTPEEEKFFNESKADFDNYMKTVQIVIDNVEKNTPESLAIARKVLDEDVHHAASKVDNYTVKVSEMYDQMARNDLKEFDDSKTQIMQMMIAVTVIAGLLIMGLLLYTGSRISRIVGDIAGSLAGSSNKVVEAVQQLSEAGNSLSQNSTEAAASLEETVAALEEMSSMVQMNSDNAKQAAALSASSRDAAEKGENEIKNLIQSMTDISQSSRKIEEIITVIDDIAFQTNLLALNASVEAARAGEQGKGFAVVAEAVRSLAQRSAASAKDISSLIKNSAEQVERGGKIADNSGEVLGLIVNSIKKVSDLNNEIAAASSEQTTGIQQISKAMNQLDQTSQANAASAEEIAATSDEINQLAKNSQTLTVDLNAAVLGGAGSGIDATSAMPSEVKSVKKAPSKKSFTSSAAKVIPMKKTSPVKAVVKSAQEAIPFDDEPRAKLGSTDEF